MSAVVGVQTDFGFSFDTIDFGPVFQRVDKGRWRWTEEDGDDLGGTSSSQTT